MSLLIDAIGIVGLSIGVLYMGTLGKLIFIFVVFPLIPFFALRVIDKNHVKYGEKTRLYKRLAYVVIVSWLAVIGYILYMWSFAGG